MTTPGDEKAQIEGGRHDPRDEEPVAPDGDGQTGVSEHAAPEQPTDLPRSAVPGVMKRTLKEFKADNLTDLAAALTYYGVLAIFPMIIVIVSVLGLIGHSATQPLIDNLGKVAPGAAKQVFTSAIKNVQSGQGTAGVLFVVGLAGALWSASGYIAAFMRASNFVWDVEEGRPIWKTIPIRIGVTLVTVILLTVSALAVILTGGLARQVGNLVGLGSSAVTVFDIVKWPVMLLIVSLILAILYWAGPNVRQPGIRVGQPRQRPRRSGVADRVGGVRLLRLQFHVVQQNLRRAGRRRVPGLAVDHHRGDSARRRAQCRAGTRPSDRGRSPRRSRAVPARAR